MASTSTVKSWIYTVPSYPETLTLSTSEVPVKPAEHHVLVKIHAAALNPVDIQIMNLPLNSLPSLNGPKIPARDFSGEILAVSPEVTAFQPGDAVFGISMDFGAHGFLTEVAHIDTRKTQFVKKPASLSWVKAASLPLVYLTARSVIEKCKPHMTAPTPADNKLAVLGGSSATGIYTVQIARSLGWTVLATCSARNAAFVTALGASAVVDYTSSASAVVDAVKAFTPAAIADCVGGTECIGLAPRYVTIVGDKTSRASLGGSALYFTTPRMLLRWLLGYVGLGCAYDCISLDVKTEWLEEAAGLSDDKIVVDSTFEFGRAAEAYERLNTGRARGKVVVTIGQ